MQKWIVVAAAMIAVTPAKAESVIDQARQVIDLQKFTCKELLNLPMDGMGIRIIYWLDGNYRDDDNTVIDTAEHVLMLAALGSYCETNPGHSVSRAAESVFKGRK